MAAGDGSRGVGNRDQSGYASPAASMTHSFAVPFSDSEDLAGNRRPRVIYLSCSGTVHYKMLSGQERTRELAAGYHPLQVIRIYETGTTVPAGSIEGHW